MAGGERESPLAAFLRAEVPDWDDEVVSRARYKGFTGQRADWENRLQFWKELVVKCARQLGVVVIEPSKVQHQWFLREGITPLGISTVLSEMRKSGELQTREELMRPQATLTQYTGSVFRQVFTWVGSQVRGTSAGAQPSSELPDMLIVTPLLQERSSLVIKALSEAEWRHVCVVTMTRFRELCGSTETADVLIAVLINQGRACLLKLDGKENIEGVKVALKDEPIPAVTEIDNQVLQLYWTLERLHQQVNILDVRVTSARAATMLALKSGDKKVALRQARRLKVLTTSKGKCETFIDRIDEVLTSVADAEATRKVADALKVGVQAMKDNHVTLAEVQTCLEEADDAVSEQRETQTTLAEAPLITGADDMDLEEEFLLLEAELDNDTVTEINDLPEAAHRDRLPAHEKSAQLDASGTSLSKPERSVEGSTKAEKYQKEEESADSLERAFAKLELELA
ncbi:hypothetical protein M758_1G316500 [Ceratodon purpureus]|nr:hypothetical protein M758_1G316500 [Ceratodon purpureus]